jgi:hypothetical protein
MNQSNQPMKNPTSKTTKAFACLALLPLISSVQAATFATGYTIGDGSLGATLVDAASHAGLATTDLRANDSGNGAGPYGFVVVYNDLWNIGDSVSLTGIAVPVRSPGGDGDDSNNTDSGTFTFTFYELNGGSQTNVWEGTNNGESALGTATIVLDWNDPGATAGSAVIIASSFDTSIDFTAQSTGLAVHMDSTSSIRTRRDDSPEPEDGLQASRASGDFADSGGDFAGHQWTIAGTAVPEPSVTLLGGLGLLGLLRRRRS